MRAAGGEYPRRSHPRTATGGGRPSHVLRYGRWPAASHPQIPSEPAARAAGPLLHGTHFQHRVVAKGPAKGTRKVAGARGVTGSCHLECLATRAGRPGAGSWTGIPRHWARPGAPSAKERPQGACQRVRGCPSTRVTMFASAAPGLRWQLTSLIRPAPQHRYGGGPPDPGPRRPRFGGTPGRSMERISPE